MNKRAILTDEHHRQVIEAERNLDAAIELMDAMEDCGTDCQQLHEVAADLKNRFAKVRHHFLPKKPKG